MTTSKYREIHRVVIDGDLEKVKQLYDENKDVLWESEDGGLYPIHLAALHGRINVLKWLLNKPSIVTTPNGVTPLHLAMQEGNIKCAELLIADGANILALDDKGRTPLQRFVEWHKPPSSFLKGLHMRRLRNHSNEVSSEESQFVDKAMDKIYEWKSKEAAEAISRPELTTDERRELIEKLRQSIKAIVVKRKEK